MTDQVPPLLSFLEVFTERERRAGGRESLTHLCYVAATVDGPEATRFHDKVYQWPAPNRSLAQAKSGACPSKEGRSAASFRAQPPPIASACVHPSWSCMILGRSWRSGEGTCRPPRTTVRLGCFSPKRASSCTTSRHLQPRPLPCCACSRGRPGPGLHLAR